MPVGRMLRVVGTVLALTGLAIQPAAAGAAASASASTTTYRLGPAVLWAGQSITNKPRVRSVLESADGRFVLSPDLDGMSLVEDIMDGFGTDVAFLPFPAPRQDSTFTTLTMQSDGNLVLRTSAGRAIWVSGTRGTGANRVELQNDGNLVIRTPANRAVWSWGTTRMGLGPGEMMRSGEVMRDLANRCRLAMQSDGNLVLYRDGRAVWASGTTVPGSSVTMQTDGNLVLRSPDGRARWASVTRAWGPRAPMWFANCTVRISDSTRPDWIVPR